MADVKDTAGTNEGDTVDTNETGTVDSNDGVDAIDSNEGGEDSSKYG